MEQNKGDGEPPEPGVAKEASFDGGYSLPDHVHKQIVDKVYQNAFINNSLGAHLYHLSADARITEAEVPALIETVERFKETWNLYLLMSTLLFGMNLPLLFEKLERHEYWEAYPDSAEALEYAFLALVTISAGLCMVSIIECVQDFYYVNALHQKEDYALLLAGSDHHTSFLFVILSFFSLFIAALCGSFLTMGFWKGVTVRSLSPGLKSVLTPHTLTPSVGRSCASHWPSFY